MMFSFLFQKKHESVHHLQHRAHTHSEALWLNSDGPSETVLIKVIDP